MGFFNFVKRLPLNCLQLAFSLVCLTFRLTTSGFCVITRNTQRLLGGLILGVGSDVHRVLILGTRNSGKTALLYRIKLGEFIYTVTTNSFIEEDCTLCSQCLIPTDICIHRDLKQVETIQLHLCEVGIQDDNDVVEKHLRHASKVIFVIDGSDLAVGVSALNDIASIVAQHNFSHQLPKYVIFNNKSDLVDTHRGYNIEDVGLPDNLKERAIWVNGSALGGQGVVESLKFLLQEDNVWGYKPIQTKRDDLIQLN
ncbi:ADP-ribosylation factor family protein [Babesia bovis T2Bo]|uniref:ADP-ribosylation factor, putative n=1 Tax=Babesia bovis TaxID=5865 RepID=A7AU70_BABBO|nr:ADP-ribosylation factor family protein [Babesia bovis T2Bo]EDO06481.1 ADP-ribosylation factor family protein [Babesia bovis T2Bo]|eukprot:XP_001610049.1 ADP-ribosylation factor [Babesia bovis T2Bo]